MAYRADKLLKEISIIDNFKYTKGATPGYFLHCIDIQGNAEWVDINNLIDFTKPLENINFQINELTKCCKDNKVSIENIKKFINTCCEKILERLNKIENDIDIINERLKGRIINKPVYIKKEIPSTKPYTAQSGLYKRKKEFKAKDTFHESQRNIITGVSDPYYDFLIGQEFFKIWQITEYLEYKNIFTKSITIKYKNIILNRDYTINLWEWEKSGKSDIKKIKISRNISEKSNLDGFNFRKK